MSKDQKVVFRKLLQHRIRLLREASEYTRGEMARMLDVLEDTYKKWEIGAGGTMPSYYYVKFCTIVRAELMDFLTPIPDEDETIALYATENMKAARDEIQRTGNSHNKEYEHPETGEIHA